MPNNPRGGGISRQISGKLREDMKRMLSNLDLPKGMSVIIRTAGIGKTQEDLQHDLNHLLNIWQAIQEQNQNIRHRALSIKKQVSLPVLSVTICVMISLRFGLITKTLILKQQALLMQWCQNKPKSYANIPIMNQCFRALISKTNRNGLSAWGTSTIRWLNRHRPNRSLWSLSTSTQLSRLKVQTLLRLLIIPT